MRMEGDVWIVVAILTAVNGVGELDVKQNYAYLYNTKQQCEANRGTHTVEIANLASASGLRLVGTLCAKIGQRV